MSMGQPKTQPAIQAGSSGKAAAVGSEVGGVHSSPIGRRDAACSHASLRGAGAGNGSKEIITPQCFGSPDARSTARPRLQPNASRRSDSESRIREIRPSGLMRGRSLTVIGASLSTRRLRPTLLTELVRAHHQNSTQNSEETLGPISPAFRGSQPMAVKERAGGRPIQPWDRTEARRD